MTSPAILSSIMSLESAGSLFDTGMTAALAAQASTVTAVTTGLAAAGLASASASLAVHTDGAAISALSAHVGSRLAGLENDMATFGAVSAVNAALGASALVTDAFGSIIAARSLLTSIPALEASLASFVASADAAARAALQETIEAAASEISGQLSNAAAQIVTETGFFAQATTVLASYAAVSKIVSMFQDPNLRAVIGAAGSDALIAALNAAL